METQTEDKVSAEQTDLDKVLEKIAEIARISADGDYIYRGEPALHEEAPYNGKVSSGLYRPFLEKGQTDVNVSGIQHQILMQARQYIPDEGEMDDLKLSATLQHFGAKTNLIDFTTDYLVALFFACDGKPQEPGRVILLQKYPESAPEPYDIEEPPRTIRRAEAQKSIFVEAPKGFVEPDKVVSIPADLKQALLRYLDKHHDILTKTIYNDLHGFIETRRLHEEAYEELYKGFTSQGRADSAKTEAEKQECYNEAITHYTAAIEFKPDLGDAYNNRGLVYHTIGDLDAAFEDFNKAIELEVKEAGVRGEYMRNRRFNRNIFGDLRTQKMAQNALPILVSHAQKGEIITLQQLAKDIAPDLTQFNWSMGWALAWIHTTLYELERSEEWKYGEIPAITAIALADRETPTNWMADQTRIDPNTPLPWEDYETKHILPVFEYPHWDKVMYFVYGRNEILADGEIPGPPTSGNSEDD